MLFYADADWGTQNFADGTPIDLVDEDTHPLIVTAMDFGRADHLVKLVRPPVLKHMCGYYYWFSETQRRRDWQDCLRSESA
jgi:hypothetical protein